MKFLLLYITGLLICSEVLAQPYYKAVYSYNIPYDMVSIYEELRAKNIRLSDYDTSETAEEVYYKKRLQKEMAKKLHQRTVLNCLCSPAGQYTELIDQPSRDVVQPGLIDVNPTEDVEDRYISSILVDYTRALFLSFSKESQQADTVYQRLDTANMRLVATGMVKEINNRVCNEYVPADSIYAGISLWLDPQLPDYINPGLWFGNGGKGGVAGVTFQKSDITIALESIKGTKEKLRLPKVPQRPTFVYNPLRYRIKDLE
jgi:hypothetical protein